MESSATQTEPIPVDNNMIREENERLRAKNIKLVTESSKLETVIAKKEAEVEEAKRNLSTMEAELRKALGIVSQLKEGKDNLVLCNLQESTAALRQQLEQVHQQLDQQNILLENQREKIDRLENEENRNQAEVSQCKEAFEKVGAENVQLKKQLKLTQENNAVNMQHLHGELKRQRVEMERLAYENLQLCKQLAATKTHQETIAALKIQLSEFQSSAEKTIAGYKKEAQKLKDKLSSQNQTRMEVITSFLREDHQQQLDRCRSFCESRSGALGDESEPLLPVVARDDLESVEIDVERVTDDGSMMSGEQQRTEGNKKSLLEGAALFYSPSKQGPSGDSDTTSTEWDVSVSRPGSPPEASLPVVARGEAVVDTETKDGRGMQESLEFCCNVCNKEFTSKKRLENHEKKKCGRGIVVEVAEPSSSTFSFKPLSFSFGKKKSSKNKQALSINSLHGKDDFRSRHGRGYYCVCGEQFPSGVFLENHINQQGGPGSRHQCRHCNIWCDDASKLSEHVLNAHKPQPINKRRFPVLEKDDEVL